MSPEDIAYYRQRASAERDRAQGQGDPVVAEIHLELAGLYEQLLGGADRSNRPKLGIVAK